MLRTSSVTGAAREVVVNTFRQFSVAGSCHVVPLSKIGALGNDESVIALLDSKEFRSVTDVIVNVPGVTATFCTKTNKHLGYAMREKVITRERMCFSGRTVLLHLRQLSLRHVFYLASGTQKLPFESHRCKWNQQLLLYALKKRTKEETNFAFICFIGRIYAAREKSCFFRCLYQKRDTYPLRRVEHISPKHQGGHVSCLIFPLFEVHVRRTTPKFCFRVGNSALNTIPPPLLGGIFFLVHYQALPLVFAADVADRSCCGPFRRKRLVLYENVWLGIASGECSILGRDCFCFCFAQDSRYNPTWS